MKHDSAAGREREPMTTPATSGRVAAIRERLGKATKTPWHAADRGIGWEVHFGADPGKCWPRPDGSWCLAINDEFRETFTEQDADFIAHAPEDMAWLLAALEAAQGAGGSAGSL